MRTERSMEGLKRARRASAAELVFRARDLRHTLEERLGVAPRPQLAAQSGVMNLMPALLVESFREREAVCGLWKRLFPGAAERVVAAAVGVCANRIPIFSDTADLGDAVDWHRDYRCGVRAPLSFGRGIDTLDPAVVGDGKNIWELNRCGYFVTLGQAFWATGDRRYFEKWKELVISWIDANPPDRGINWNSSLELAMRAVSWLWSSWFFRAELEADDAFLLRFGETILLHGDRIERHLSRYFSPNTHLTGEALGLLYIGKAYPAAPRSRVLVALGESILRAELERQILADGGYFERATWYHKYTIDFYLHMLLLVGPDDAAADAAADAVKRMTAHLVLLSESDGTIPLIGDADGGQLLFLDGRKGNVHGACCTAAALLGDGDLKDLAGGEFQEETLWLLGPSGLDRFKRMERMRRRSFHSINKETGWYCLRTGMGPDDAYVIFDCGPHGWDGCGHAHADLLSVLWNARRTMALVDPGCPVYGGDPALRNRTRSSACHNTITIGGESQSVPGALFRWRRIARPVLSRSFIEGECGFVEGQHDGYDDIGCRHWRGVLFCGYDLVVVADVVRCASRVPSILYNMQFGEGALESAGAGFFRFAPANGGPALAMRIFGAKADARQGAAPANAAAGACVPGSPLTPVVAEGIVSRDYNHLRAAPRVVWELGASSGDILILTLLSRDPKALASFAHDGLGALHGGIGDAQYAISVEAAPVGSGRPPGLLVKPRVKASVEGNGTRRVLSLSAEGPDGWRTESEGEKRQ